jgi:D-threo-aldose 1-dehydrogenase
MSIRDKLVSGRLGFGSAPLGNMFRNIPEAEAAATVDAAWQQGIRYFDTEPLYGVGLSKMRPGRALSKHKRDEYVLSSKVGRLILDEMESGPRQLGEKVRPHARGCSVRSAPRHRPARRRVDSRPLA